MSTLSRYILAIVTTATLLPGAAHAILEEVIVTAQKREENMQSVALAVTALNAETLRNAAILNIEDIARHAPNFTVTVANPVSPQPFIRGVGSNSGDAGSDTSVGVFIDGVYAGRAGSYRTDMYDIQRVEILRGPQGTLFGRNVAGGALNITTHAPEPIDSGWLEGALGNYNLWGLKGMLNGALTDAVAGRLAFSIRQRDGVVRNTFTGNKLHDADNKSVRGRLLWDASEAFSVLFSADYSEDQFHGPAARNYDGASPQDVLDSVGIGFLAPFLLPTSSDPYKVEAAIDGRADRDMGSATLQMDWDTSLGTITAITGYRKTDYFFEDDVFGLAFAPASGIAPLLTGTADEQSTQTSQELRITSQGESLVWTAGLYFLHEDVNRPANFTPLGARVIYDQAADTTSYAAFAQATLNLTQDWALTAGGRYSRDQKDFSLATDGVEIGFGLLTPDPMNLAAGPVPFATKDSHSWDNFSPRLALEYTPGDDLLAYLSWSRGYKSGGYNGNATNFTAASTPFDEETVDNYEIGLKTDFLADTMRLNVSAFYMDYQDLQVFVASFETAAGLFVDNAGQADIYGLETEFFYAPNEQLTFSASYAWLDTRVGKNDMPTVDKGNKLTRSPENSVSVSAQYRRPVGQLGDLLLRADYAWQDKFYFQPENPEVSAQDAYGLLNLRAALQAGSGWELALWVKNAADQAYRMAAFDSSFGSDLGSSSIPGDPRTWGLTGRYSW